MNIEGLSIYTLAQELNQLLAGGRIIKILQPTRNLFLLKIRQIEQEYTLAISVDPGDPRMHLTRETRENPVEPSSLCMLLRKQLLDGRIAAVMQERLDRVLHIPVDIRGTAGRIETKTLTVELAGKNSNLIFNIDGLIVDASRRVGLNTSRVRQIVPGIPYVLPPAPVRSNPLQTSPELLVDLVISQDNLNLSKALMASMEGIGPLGTAEIISRAGMKPSQPAGGLTPEDRKTLATALVSFTSSFDSLPASAFVALDAENRLLAVAAFEPTHLGSVDLRRFASFNEAVAFAATLAPAPRTTLHQDTLRRVRTELDKLERKQILLEQELAESQNAENHRMAADLLMANLHRLQTGKKSVTVADYFNAAPDGTPPEIDIFLDPALSPMENIQRYYKKYSRAKRAQELIQTQIVQCLEDIRYLETVALPLSDNASNQEIQEIIQELADSGYIQAVKRPRAFSRPSEPRRIVLPSGAVIFVGRNNRQNDLVTFKTAQPRDLWFHTKDIPGSHVILRTSSTIPLISDIEKAAHLAAWFSKSRNSAKVPVDYTERRHVKKPAGAKPGFVIYEKQKTLWVTPDEATINTLLQEKIKPPAPE